ncbi:MAG: hypothetical protein ABSC19_01840 [Syntrophorhabdales bacterium]|jgi:hypothetical protein
MSGLFTQSFNIIPGKESDYGSFVTGTMLPVMTAIGLAPVGAYYVEVGSGPKIFGVHRAVDIGQACRLVTTSEFKEVVLQLKSYVYKYRTALLEPAGKVKHVEYVIRKGVWKFHQYYDLRPGIKREYADFIMSEYIPALEKLEYVEVTGGWNVVLGGVSEIIGELTFTHPVDIGLMLNSQEYRHANQRLQDKFVTNYQNKILRCTERFDEPNWLEL